MNSLPVRPFKEILFSVKEFNRRYDADSRFREFARQVYHYLEGMKVNKELRLNRYSGEKLEWIVLTASAFIAEGFHSLEYSFNDDFTAIQHTYIEPEIIAECRDYKFNDINKDNNEQQ